MRHRPIGEWRRELVGWSCAAELLHESLRRFEWGGLLGGSELRGRSLREPRKTIQTLLGLFGSTAGHAQLAYASSSAQTAGWYDRPPSIDLPKFTHA